MSYKYHRRNPKTIALIVEIILLLVSGITCMILGGVGVNLPWIPIVIIFAVLMFAFLLTLSLLRLDAMKDIRADGSFKNTNLPLYTDQTTLQAHDIIEENRRKND